MLAELNVRLSFYLVLIITACVIGVRPLFVHYVFMNTVRLFMCRMSNLFLVRHVQFEISRCAHHERDFWIQS
jgi:hypothetical protein